MGRHYAGDARRVFPIRLAAAELELLERAAHRAQPFALSRPSVGEFVRDAALAHARQVLATVARPGEAAVVDERQTDLERRLEGRTVAIVGCGAAKATRAVPARELYTGDVTRWALELAELELGAARVRILSARFGLLELQNVIPPYDLELADLKGADLERWRRELVGDLGRFLRMYEPSEVRVYAGERYAAEVRRALDELGREEPGELEVAIREPLEGLTTGRRRSRLLELLQVARKRNTNPTASSSSSAPAASSSPKKGARTPGGKGRISGVGADAIRRAVAKGPSSSSPTPPARRGDRGLPFYGPGRKFPPDATLETECAECGRPLGEHDGKRCPPASSSSPRTTRRRR